MTLIQDEKELNDLHWMVQMLQTVDVGLIVLDQEGRILLWNSFMENHSGIRSKQALNQTLKTLFPKLPHAWLQRKLDAVFKLGSPAYSTWEQRPRLFDFKSYRPLTGGSELMYQNLTLMPLQGRNNKTSQVCLLVYDVTENAISKLQLETANAELARLSRTDRLTELFNRGYWEECLNQEFLRAQRSGGESSLIIFDIDHFKKVNDTHGHQAGDEVIREVAKILRSTARETDFPGRYGGEEFVLLLPDTPASGALEVAERARKKLEATRIHYEDLVLQVTISLGISSFSPDLVSAQQWLERADQALYQAKNAGRNQTCLWQG
ncbi:PAS domain S-box-containing protein/diguanylate cyclase (GGDEF) domain-containing protein [Marinospirillum celere]|uniref:diguanylate cyclase n=1 Tax=Marinospirillum celere TaxID=1122252 RepID=A0A1I1E5I6_9GAMM|nr:diguanylate cyclase [Marinospirillum celere]SFB82431.1 PAS domain S-box-containing protein/diguanylate cyclase (GGDEF) domain-containing protein [Marinospirillum celere]